MARGDFERVLLVGNPISGGRKVGRWFDAVAREFARTDLRVEEVVTQFAGHGRQSANNHGSRHALVVAFGGDGTFNEVLNGADLERSTLAIVPAGTGNVLAKELGMARHPLRAARQLMRGRLVRLDVGRCNGRRFICIFGAGVDASVVRMVHAARGDRLTQLHYVPHAARALLQRVPWRIAVEADGRALAEGLDQVNVGNTHSYGGPMEMTPAAGPADGLLDVMCMPRLGPADVAGLTACGFLRSLHRTPAVTYGRARRVRVTAGRDGVPYQIDGEAAGVLPAELSVEPGAVQVLVPASFRPRRALPVNG
jgi:YegS/Rv2252/BmrU family lipid kinase